MSEYFDKEKEKNRIFVTGGTEGIGKAIAENFLNAHHQVAMCARTSDNIDRSRRAGFTAEVFDLSDTSSLPDFSKKISAELGGVDCIVLNAGVSGVPMNEETLEDKETREKMTMDINYEAPRIITESLVEELRQNKGVIAFLTSRFAKAENPPESARPYSESKKQLEKYFLKFAADPVNKDILVIGIDPGAVDTGLRQKIIASKVAPQLSTIALQEKEEGKVADPALVGRAIFRILNSRFNFDPTTGKYDKGIQSGSILTISNAHLEYEREVIKNDES